MIAPREKQLIHVLAIAAEHLAEYRAYAESMRAIGRGMYPCSDYPPDELADLIAQTLTRAARPTPRPPAPPAPAVVDTSTLSTKELYAYYKRTAPAEDIAFVLRLRPELAPEFEGLTPTRALARRAFDRFRMLPSRDAAQATERAA